MERDAYQLSWATARAGVPAVSPSASTARARKKPLRLMVYSCRERVWAGGHSAGLVTTVRTCVWLSSPARLYAPRRRGLRPFGTFLRAEAARRPGPPGLT